MLDGKFFLGFVWAVTLLSLLYLIPKNKVRLAWVAFLFKELLTWPLGLLTVEMGWIEYPIRFLEKANHTSFTFEYFFYPVICAYFNVYYPEGKKQWIQILYYVLFCSVLTLAELFLMQHTMLIRYIHWSGYTSWITFFITFYVTRRFCLWFFRPYQKEQAEH